VIRGPIFVFTITARSGHGIRGRGSLPAHGVTASRPRCTPGGHERQKLWVGLLYSVARRSRGRFRVAFRVAPLVRFIPAGLTLSSSWRSLPPACRRYEMLFERVGTRAGKRSAPIRVNAYSSACYILFTFPKNGTASD